MGREDDQYGIVPPSTGNRQPVMLAIDGDASSTATLATSSKVLGRSIRDRRQVGGWARGARGGWR